MKTPSATTNMRWLGWAVLLLMASTSQAALTEIYLRAGIATNLMPDGRAVVMWGFAQDSGPLDDDGILTIPGPAIELGAGSQDLVIHLKNRIPEPTSIVIPGQRAVLGDPQRNPDGRVRSFTHEAAPGGTADYTWTDLQPGTYVYHSGSHPAVQVQMGLYGALTKLDDVRIAYPGVPFDTEEILLFSEIDPDLHDAVAADDFGPGKAMTSTLRYRPQYFFINGASYTNDPSPVRVGNAGSRILLRMINVGLDYHAPTINGSYVSLVAEDGNPLPYPRETYSAWLAPLKTMDAILTVSTGTPIAKKAARSGGSPTLFALYDRRLALVNSTSGSGGMLVNLLVTEGITDVESDEANVGGGIEVEIEGTWLGNGSDVESVTLAGVPATILSQSSNEVRVRVGAAPAAVTGDVVVTSASFGSTMTADAFEYLWLDAPVQLDPTDRMLTSLRARWQTVPSAATHVLQVGLDTGFTALLPGYEGLNLGPTQVQHQVTGLMDDTFYAIRLFAWNAAGFSLPSRTVWISTPTVKPNDYDADGQADIAAFYPSNGYWRMTSYRSALVWNSTWGWSSTVPAPADYDGDAETDVAVYHPGTGTWYIQPSSGGTGLEKHFGWNATAPVPGDYDGDGTADLAVFDQSQGRWHFRLSSGGADYSVSWGWSATVPVPADYDGDGKTDIAVYHPASGNWYVLKSSNLQMLQVNWGWSAAIPVPGDYDGDGLADIAVFHRASGNWYLRLSAGGGPTVQFGWSSVKPVAADYDGDGKTDIAVYHPATGNWHVRKSSTLGITVMQNGGPGGIPSLLYPMLHTWYGLP